MDKLKEQERFTTFMKNSYWKEYYEKAPSETLKKYIYTIFEYSCREQNNNSNDYFIEFKKIENELNVSDYLYLINHANTEGAKSYYNEKIKAVIDSSGLYTVFHIPHDGCYFPTELMSSVIVSYDDFLSYHNEMRDAEVKQFVPEITRSDTVAFEISRLLCDVERFTDGTEIMDKYGMGFCYEKVYDGVTIKNVSNKLKQQTYSYYEKHHKKMDDVIKQRQNGVLLIDLHSFSEKIIMNELKDNAKQISDICLGYDVAYCPQVLLSIAQKCFATSGFSVEVNYPYTGSYIPNSILSGEIKTEFASIMIEINKKLYMNNKEDNTTVVRKIKNAIFQTIALYSEIKN